MKLEKIRKLSLYSLFMAIIIGAAFIKIQAVLVVSGLFLVGIFIAIIVRYEQNNRINKLDLLQKEGIITEGEITEVHYGTPLYGNTFYRYTDFNDNIYEKSELIGFKCLKYKKGKKILVMYNKSNPNISSIYFN